jgi:hypothetical protein
MNLPVRRLLPSALVVFLLLAAPTAYALTNTITAADFTGPDSNVGYNSKLFPFATVSSLNGDHFSKKTINGFQNVGATPSIQGEFSLTQLTPQGMVVTYFTPQTIASITLGFLYPKQVFSDTNNEVAEITFNGSTTYKLEATGSTTFLWSGAGSAANVDPATGGKAGEWKITNPFIGPVTSITLTPFDTGAGMDFRNSDFGVGSIVSAVPEPVSILLLGSAMALALARKKVCHS